MISERRAEMDSDSAANPRFVTEKSRMRRMAGCERAAHMRSAREPPWPQIPSPRAPHSTRASAWMVGNDGNGAGNLPESPNEHDLIDFAVDSPVDVKRKSCFCE
jgi:hypothetical protein